MATLIKKIGVVIAVEIDAFEKKYGKPDEIIIIHHQEVMKYITDKYELYAVHSGAGEIAAASTTQLLISEFNVDAIFNFGVVGGLTEEISEHRLCVVQNVVHYDFDTSEVDECEVGRYLNYPTIYLPTDQNLLKKAIEIAPELMQVTCASGDKFIASTEKKKELQQKFHVDICEMEAAGIVLTCNRNEIPCLLIKMVADGIADGAEEFLKEKQKSSEKCLDVFEQVVLQL